jgi:hypothetical protein
VAPSGAATNARSIGYSLKATRHIPNYSLSITVEQQDVSNCHDAYYGQRFRQDKSISGNLTRPGNVARFDNAKRIDNDKELIARSVSVAGKNR